MPQVYLTTNHVKLDENQNPVLVYGVILIGPPHREYGATYNLDTKLSLDDNLIVLWKKVIADAATNGVVINDTNLCGFGTPKVGAGAQVTAQDLSKAIVTSKELVADASTEEPSLWAKTVQSVKEFFA